MEFKHLLKKRRKDTDKGDYGYVFVIAGSRGLTGAASLCSKACLRTGAGIVTLAIPYSLNIAMEVKLTEVMTCPLPETLEGTLALGAKKEIIERVKKSDVIILGPGLSTNKETVKLIRHLVVRIEKPMVIDADGLNAISNDTDIIKRKGSRYIITPHPGEMARLVKKSVSYIKDNRITVAKGFADHYNAVVVLKGFETVVAEPNKEILPYINKSGNPGMATAGSGDVLTGVIGGLLAQGLESFDAARLGVYLHGLAGDLAAKEKGEIGIIASDILEKIPLAIKIAT